MADMMTFPATVEEFMEQYKTTDTKHEYSNGTEYVHIYRMKQWFEHAASIDVVPVVRCKDCRHMEKSQYGRYCQIWGMDDGAGEDGFCSYGEM